MTRKRATTPPAPVVPRPAPIDAKRKDDPGKEEPLRDIAFRALAIAAYNGWIGPLIFFVPDTNFHYCAFLPPGTTEADFGGREGMPNLPIEGIPSFVAALAMVHGEQEFRAVAHSDQTLFDYLIGLGR